MLMLHINNKLLCLLGLKAHISTGKVKPKKPCCEVWMKKIKSEKQLTRNMKMKIGADINPTVEILSKNYYTTQT